MSPYRQMGRRDGDVDPGLWAVYNRRLQFICAVSGWIRWVLVAALTLCLPLLYYMVQ